ncbi:MAG: hypothetical protein MJ206_00525 [Bacilli bacterium]|nr:hypothetical protein [Bacilli bacterium]
MKNKKRLKALGITLAILAVLLLVTWAIFAIKQDSPDSPPPPEQVVALDKVLAMFIGLFTIALLGQLLGSISIKNVSLGSAGAFLVAILFGFLFTMIPEDLPILRYFRIDPTTISTDLGNIGYWYANILQNFGLILFISAVGFMAGPTFFKSFQQNAKAYIVLAVVVSLAGQLMAAAIAPIPGIGVGYAAGIFAGALTSTPAYAAALNAANLISPTLATNVTVGYAITYPFGVIGVVLFIQLMPRILHADMAKEREAIKIDVSTDRTVGTIDMKALYKFDPYGLFPMFMAIIAGILVGLIRIPLTMQGFAGPCFSLGTTGGVLFSCLLMGHFGHFGRVSLEVSDQTNKTFRELGLLIFLIGAGVNGGAQIVQGISQNEQGPLIIVYIFVLGAIITILPALIGFIIAQKILKLPLLNNLGAITGSMTSTPSLASLINAAKTEDVAAAYAIAFPLATILTTITNNLFVSI